ncbi:hypothetical protein B0H19DRAFT_76071 [Mycena capillaripes]|nr:hypothetical protein B0H19DRAFT_76071 [Mycena capillaripes]
MDLDLDNVLKAHLDLSKTLIVYRAQIQTLEGELQQKTDAELSRVTELDNANTQIAALQTEIATLQEAKKNMEGWYRQLRKGEDALKQGHRELEEKRTAVMRAVEEQRQTAKILEEQQAERCKEEAAMTDRRLEMNRESETTKQTLEALQADLRAGQSVLEQARQQMGAECQQRTQILDEREIGLRGRETIMEGLRQDLERQTEELGQRAKTLDDLQGTLQAKESDVEGHKAELGQRARTLDDLQGTLQAKESDVEGKMERLHQETQERHAELARRESQLIAGRQDIKQRMDTFAQWVEELVQQNEANADILRERLRDALTEKDELQRRFAAGELSAKADSYNALLEAHQILEGNLGIMQSRAVNAESVLCEEFRRRQRAENERESIRADLGNYCINSEATKRDLQMKLDDARSRATTLEAERVELLIEMDRLHARHPAVGDNQPAQGTEPFTTNAQDLNEQQQMQDYITMLHAQLTSLQANLDDANRRAMAYKQEKNDMEGTLATKDSELQVQREKSDTKIAGLKQKLRSFEEDVVTLGTENTKLGSENNNLKQTLKQQRLKVSELKKKIGRLEQSVANAKVEKVEQDDRYDELVGYYEAQTTALEERDVTIAEEGQKFQALSKEFEQLQETVTKLQTPSKNLRRR